MSILVIVFDAFAGLLSYPNYICNATLSGHSFTLFLCGDDMSLLPGVDIGLLLAVDKSPFILLCGREFFPTTAEPVGRTYTSMRFRSVFADFVCRSTVNFGVLSCG